MKHLIIGTAGHVDHGKTALVKALTNIDCDTHKEEKERGITINLGFSHLDIPGGESIGIVDVPGHKDFIKTMVAGAYGIDIAMLVIAADSGIMPQTEEHLSILEMLGVEQGIVVLTKADLVDRETLELAELEIIEYLEGTALENSPVVSVSSVTGEGIPQLVSTIQEILPKVKERDPGSIFRMYIDRIFNIRGLGYVVTGSVLEGSVRMGSDLYLLPGRSKKVKVRNLERHGVTVDTVHQGDRAALNLAGLKMEDYTRGMVLSNKQLEDTQMVDATLKIFDPESVLPVWSNVLFFSGTYETAARMHLLDKDELLPGESGIVQLHFSKPAVLAVKDKFIVRNSSNDRTLGGGTIIDIKPLHHRKRSEKLVHELNDLMEATLHSDSLVSLIRLELNKINRPVSAAEISSILKTTRDAILEELKNDQSGKILMVEAEGQEILITPEAYQHYRNQVIDELKSYHRRYPILEEGLGTNEFLGKFGFGKQETGKLFLDLLMVRLHEEGIIRKEGPTWSMAEHQVVLDQKSKDELQWLGDLYQDTGMDIPNTRDIEDKIHERRINKDRYKMLLRYLTTKGILVFYDGIFIHQLIVADVQKTLLKKIATKEDGINEKEFRELIGGTRKFAQVLLGIFVDEGIVTKPTFYILITDKGKKLAETIK